MKKIVVYSFILMSFITKSQVEIPKQQFSKMIWVGYYNSVMLNEKWNINTDVQFRTKNWYQHPSQALIRTGLAYKFNKKLNVTMGIAHFRFYLNDTKTRGEWRPWQEVSYTENVHKLQIVQRIRVEQRFNQKVINLEPVNDYAFNWRFRYKLELQYPIYNINEKAIRLIVGNEIMINEGKTIVNNYFDQNRSYVGINYEYTKNFTFQFQSIHIWQQHSNGITIDNISVIRFNIIHKLKL